LEANGQEKRRDPRILSIVYANWRIVHVFLDAIVIHTPFLFTGCDGYPKVERSFHFGISFASHMEVPILVSKNTHVDSCRRPSFLPSLLPERMSMSSDQ